MQQKLILSVLGILLIAGCSSKKTTSSSEARTELEKTFTPKVGSATKTEFIEEFGNPQWCRDQSSGGESCRFYRKKGTKWLGDKKDRQHYEAYDEIYADFDPSGVLTKFKASAQR